jgi:hypothetical protein
MKRFVISAVLFFLCLTLPSSLAARYIKPVPGISGMKHIFLGWIDLGPDNYRSLGYTLKNDWVKVIEDENTQFQEDFQTKMAGRSVVMAKNRDDVNTAGNDLYVKFTDAYVDHGYRLHVALHLIDLKTNTEITSLPVLNLNSGGICTLESCLSKDLNVLNEKLQLLIVGGKQKMKTRMQDR